MTPRPTSQEGGDELQCVPPCQAFQTKLFQSSATGVTEKLNESRPEQFSRLRGQCLSHEDVIWRRGIKERACLPGSGFHCANAQAWGQPQPQAPSFVCHKVLSVCAHFGPCLSPAWLRSLGPQAPQDGHLPQYFRPGYAIQVRSPKVNVKAPSPGFFQHARTAHYCLVEEVDCGSTLSRKDSCQ